MIRVGQEERGARGEKREERGEGERVGAFK